MRTVVIVAMLALSSACATGAPQVLPQPIEPQHGLVSSPRAVESPAPGVREIWQMTLLSIGPLASRGDFLTADSTLITFASRYDGTCYAAEAGFTRALLRLAPSNAAASASEAQRLLDVYTASTCLSQSRAAEVAVLRKIATDDIRIATLKDSSSAGEIKKLKEQLDQARKELERLKLRVIPPVSRDTTVKQGMVIPPETAPEPGNSVLPERA